MKKAILISMISVFLLAAKSEAQQFRFVTSVGVQQQWSIPYQVQYELEHYYHGYDLVHARNFWSNGQQIFDITVRRGSIFVQLEIGNRGFVYSRNVTKTFPFQGHVCGSHCGFHNDFYVQNVAICGGPVYYGNRQPIRPQSVVYVNTHRGNHHYKQKANSNHGHHYGQNDQRSSGRSHNIDQGQSNRSSNSRSGVTQSNARSSRSPASNQNRSSQTTTRSRSRVN